MVIIPTYLRVSFLRLTHSEASEVPNDCQQHLALPKTMPTDAASPCRSGVADFRARALALGLRILCSNICNLFYS